MATYLVKDGQTLFDLALQLYGDVSKVYELIALNSSIENINSNDLQGVTITYNDPKNDVSEFFKNKPVVLSNRYPEVDSGKYCLLQENGFFLLLENGNKILLE